jgi:prepilin-type N-terminal cleavage/methylation domain-containing protein
MRSKANYTGNRDARTLAALAGYPESRHGVPSYPRRGFTLMEMVVAVGAVALVAVGLASIFDTVGKTVAGGKRVSNLNTYAGLLEKQMRTDFEAMTRDGFLMIRQQWVDRNADGIYDRAADVVQVSPMDLAQRGRRMDEIQFFVNGRFASGRMPLFPGVQASSGVAAVYYGHGQTSDPPSPPDSAHPTYKKPFPKVSDHGGSPGATLGLGGLNHYAGNWTLLRHLTLLCKPGSADTIPVPDNVSNLFGRDPKNPREHVFFTDQLTQASLIPAASSLFRSVALNFPAGEATFRAMADGGGQFNRPLRGSGLIDIASTDLSELRAYITSCQTYPSQITANPNSLPPPSRIFVPERDELSDQFRHARPAPNNYTDTDRIHAWMQDTWPTDSRNLAAMATANDIPPDTAAGDIVGARIRYEPDSPDLLTAMSAMPDGTPLPANFDPQSLQGLQVSQARADQLMLGRSILVPHCSEFIVEWSFGNTDAKGEVVWHGPRRQADTNGNGVIDVNDGIVVRPYPFDAQNFERDKDVLIGTRTDANGTHAATHRVTDRLIYGFSPVHDDTTPEEACLTSYFGWTDPTYIPPQSTAQNLYNVVSQVDWPWPRMIRVTVTLSDPQDPTIESTFQYVFSTPADPK